MMHFTSAFRRLADESSYAEAVVDCYCRVSEALVIKPAARSSKVPFGSSGLS